MAAEYMVTKEPRMSPVHPGEILCEEVLPALKLSVSEAVRLLEKGGQRQIIISRLGAPCPSPRLPAT